MVISDWLAYRRERSVYIAHRQLLRPFPPATVIKSFEQKRVEMNAAIQRYAVHAQNNYRPDTTHWTPNGWVVIPPSGSFDMLGKLIGWREGK